MPYKLENESLATIKQYLADPTPLIKDILYKVATYSESRLATYDYLRENEPTPEWEEKTWFFLRREENPFSKGEEDAVRCVWIWQKSVIDVLSDWQNSGKHFPDFIRVKRNENGDIIDGEVIDWEEINSFEDLITLMKKINPLWIIRAHRILTSGGDISRWGEAKDFQDDYEMTDMEHREICQALKERVVVESAEGKKEKEKGKKEEEEEEEGKKKEKEKEEGREKPLFAKPMVIELEPTAKSFVPKRRVNREDNISHWLNHGSSRISLMSATPIDRSEESLEKFLAMLQPRENVDNPLPNTPAQNAAPLTDHSWRGVRPEYPVVHQVEGRILRAAAVEKEAEELEGEKEAEVARELAAGFNILDMMD